MGDTQDQANQKIVGRIQKLLALATSPNEHEAKAAAEMAQSLLLKHNLDLQEIKSQQEYVDESIADEPYVRMHQPMVLRILEAHFFVKPYSDSVFVKRTADGRRQFQKKIRLMGTPTNVQIAQYVFDFLSEAFQRQWLEFKRANSLSERPRKAYYLGLTKGILSSLDEMKARVENERGLVWVGDPGLTAFAARLNLQSNPQRVRRDGAAEEAGFEHGKKIQIARGLNGPAKQSNRLLK